MAEISKSKISNSQDTENTPNVPGEFKCIGDNFKTLKDVSDKIKAEGVKECGLIFGIDYTLSNNIQGQKTFNGKCLHAISDEGPNPYQEVICILGETLESLDDDGVIPAYGFGDTKVKDKGVFPLKGTTELNGFGEVLTAYNELTPTIALGGPTNYAPLILKTIEIAKDLNKYHILIIAADGQVSSEQETIDAIVEASNYPISIVVIGVGDGPWDVMKDFDDKLPARQFDNFQFVDFHEAKEGAKCPEAAVALAALMEIPDQYRFIMDNNLLHITTQMELLKTD